MEKRFTAVPRALVPHRWRFLVGARQHRHRRVLRSVPVDRDYLLVPRVIGSAVKVPAGVTMVAVLIGAALLGIVGALVAIPVAAALQLLTQEVLFPILDDA